MKPFVLALGLLLAGCSDQPAALNRAAREKIIAQFQMASSVSGPLSQAEIYHYAVDDKERAELVSGVRKGDLVFLVEQADRLPSTVAHSDGSKITDWHDARCLAVVRGGEFSAAYFAASDSEPNQ